jgi:hypothetical protein
MSRQLRAGSRDFRWAPERFEAVGAVRVKDPAQGMEARGRRVTGSLVADSAILFGDADNPASAVQIKDGRRTTVQSPDRIVLHRFAGGAFESDIFGPGRIVAPIDRGLADNTKPAGKPDPQRKPDPKADGGTLTLTWTEGLRYTEGAAADGAKPAARAVATGDVVAEIDRTDPNGGTFRDRITGRRVAVDLDIRPKTPAMPETDPGRSGERTGGERAGERGADERGPAERKDDDGGTRRVRTITVEEDVLVESRETAADGTRRMFVLAAPKDLKYHLSEQRLQIVGDGELGIDEVTPLFKELDGRIVPVVGEDERPVFKTTRGGFRWKESMDWARPEARMRLVGDVMLVSKGSDSLLKKGAGGALGGGLPGGRRGGADEEIVVTTMTCRDLVVDLVGGSAAATASQKPVSADIKGKGFSGVRRFEARGDVVYKEGNTTVRSDTAIFERQPGRDGDVETLLLRGRKGQPAEVVEADAKTGNYRPMTGDYLVGRRNKAGDLYFRAGNAGGSAAEGGK